ncbi:MAG TPA: NADH-quinone oxidoreductase subunit NuoG [bacterium]|nr:NADH-quinone oxidoreductase subunit NuoG [bacterium]
MSTPPPTISLSIDGRTVSVPKGTTIYHAARHAGIEIPIFCYHDRMPPLGACRMCLVHVERAPKLQTSCTLEAAEGMVVHTATPEVKAGQEAILEYLLINHPLDCPICDKGGECPLQDQTYRWGPGRSRYTEVKRDFAKPVSLGSVLVLDRERCILCWRCVRFGEIIAGDDALKGFERGFESNINTPFTLPVASKFIGNTIAICPVGALTSRSYRFISRPWDNRTAANVCTLCGLGCAVWLDARGDRLTRLRPREERAVNDVWLCDLGFFGHGYVHHDDRLRQPLIRREGRLQPATWDIALDLVASRLRRAGPRVGVLAGTRMTNEDAYVAARFFRAVVGTTHLDHRADARGGSVSLEVAWGMRTPIAGIEQGDVILLAGCDVTETYPVLWLRIKQAIDRGAVVLALTPKALEVDRHLAHHLVHRYGEGAAVVEALSAALDGRGPDGDRGGVAHGRLMLAAKTLQAAQRPVVLVGTLSLDAPDGRQMWQALRDLCARWKVEPSVMRGRGNAFGVALAGLLPERGPGGRPLVEVSDALASTWGAKVAAGAGFSSPEMIDAAARGELDVLYVVGGDPATDVPDARRWQAARAQVPFVVVQDAFLTPTAAASDVVLPALVLPEKDGTVSNIEGRVQQLRRIVAGPGEARSDAVIFSTLAARLGRTIAYSGWEEIFDEMRTLIPGLAIDAVLPLAAPNPEPRTPNPAADLGTAAAADSLVLIPGSALFDRGSMSSRSGAIADLAGAPWALLHPDDAGRLGVGEGDSIVLTSAHGSIALRAMVAPAVLPGQVYVPRGYDVAPVNALIDASRPVSRVRLEVLAAVAGAAGAPEGGA